MTETLNRKIVACTLVLFFSGLWLASWADDYQMPHNAPAAIEHLTPEATPYPARKPPVPEGQEHLRPLPDKKIFIKIDIPLSRDEALTQKGLLFAAAQAVRVRK